jgi:trimethylamine--corrinoid protein Co-methyltransferase
MTGILPVLAGANIIYGGGILDSGMVMSLGQLVADADIIRMYRKAQEGIPVDDITMALDVIREVGIRGNYFAEDHTLNHYAEQTNPQIFQRGVSTDQAKELKRIADERAREILKENRGKLAVLQEVADKIHQMVLEAEEKQLNLKYGKVD